MKLDATNPYVGLRPYEAEESLLFFGRSDQTLELLQRLHQHHFVAVVGGSGCGKSSLLRAGLIPTLKAGYLVEDSDYWIIGIMKPGNSPLYNMAETLLRQINAETNETAVAELVEKIKEEGAGALINILESLKKERHLNFFLLIDQFEELFRFALDQNNVNKKDEAIDFVNIMLELSNQLIIPFYVVMTMRSDFIGDCAQFFGLPEAMNKSLYLVPKLNRRQLKTVIESPAQLFGGKLHASLTSLLLNELGKVKDELPLLQHTLMRMWDFSMNIDKNGELDLIDYENIGGLEKALSKHADEALIGMSKEDLLLTKHIFQALTAIDESGRKIRRPVLISQLKELTGANEEKLFNVINRFNEDKRSFLIVNSSGNTGDKVIDISHESLIRQWNTLSEWVEEEGVSAANYLQLNEAAKLYHQNKKDLLSGTELQLSLDWYNTFKPTPGWANRYKKGFEVSQHYLIESEKERSRLLDIEKAKKLMRKRLMFFIFILLFIGAIGSGSAYFYINAQKAKVDIAYMEADSQRIEADNQAQIAEQEKRNAEEQAIIAEQEKRNAEEQAKIAVKEKRNALKQTEIAKRQMNIATEEKKKAEANYLISEANRFVNLDPTLSLNLAVEALKLVDDIIIQSDALNIYRNNSFYKTIASETTSIFSIAISPDGKSILTTSMDNTARLWNLNGKMKLELSGHSDIISSVAFSPDGKTILTGSYDSTAALWNLKGDRMQTFSGHKNYISSVAFSSDGKLILTGSGDKTARVWNLNGEMITECTGHNDKITSVAFSPKGNIILTGSYDSTALLWNMQGEIIETFRGHKGVVSSVSFSPDGSKILTGSFDKTALLWNLDGDILQKFSGHKYIISSVSFSPPGNSILTGSFDNTARTWNLNGDMQQELIGHSSIISSVAYSPDGKSVITGSKDNTCRIWVVKGEKVREFTAHKNSIQSLTYSPDGKTILTGSEDQSARLWSMYGELLQDFIGHTKLVTSVAFSPNGKTILTGSYDMTARLWNLNGGLEQDFIGHTDEISSVAFSPNGKTILTGSYDMTARLWNLQGDTIQVFPGHKSAVDAIAFSTDGKTIITCSADKKIRLWNLKGEIIREFENPELMSSVTFSPDGDLILTGSYDNIARLWNIEGDMIQEFTGHDALINSVAFSPDGKTILTGSYDKTARLWNLQGEMVQEFSGSESVIFSVAFSPDGNTILTGSYNGKVCLWNVDIPLTDFLQSNWLEPLSAEQKKRFKIEY